MTKTKFTYMMSADYCKNWKIEHAIREVIANALDSTQNVNISWSGGVGKVIDHGQGITAQALAIGQSAKGANQIGQFGEGLKVAALVMAREGRRLAIRSNGSQFDFRMEHDATLGMKVLTVTIQKGLSAIRGAVVKFDCTSQELDRAKSLFLKFHPVPTFDKTILNNPGCVYVMGLLTTTQERMLFGYNLTSKAIMNRDRTVIDGQELNRQIGWAIANTRSRPVIAKYLQAAIEKRNCYEHQVYCLLNKKNTVLWRQIAHQVFGRKFCISSGSADGRAAYFGYNVVDVPYNVQDILQGLGFKTAQMVAPDKETFKFVNVNKLNTEERKNLNKARRAAKKCATTEGYRIMITEGMKCWGTVVSNQLRIERCRLDKAETACDTVLHELAHWQSGTTDVSEGFERELSQMLGRLAGTMR